MRPVIFAEFLQKMQIVCTDKASGKEVPVLPTAFLEKICLRAIRQGCFSDAELVGAVKAVAECMIKVGKGGEFVATTNALVKHMMEYQVCMTYAAVMASCAAVLILGLEVAVEDAELTRKLLQQARTDGPGSVMWSSESGEFADALLGLSWAE